MGSDRDPLFRERSKGYLVSLSDRRVTPSRRCEGLPLSALPALLSLPQGDVAYFPPSPRECPALEVDFSIGGRRVRGVLDQLAEMRGLPEVITLDNGSECTCNAMDEGAHRHGVKLDFIPPAQPLESAYRESFNGRLRDECMNENQFLTRQEARTLSEMGRKEDNDERPHGSLTGLTPRAFAERDGGMLPQNGTSKPQLT